MNIALPLEQTNQNKALIRLTEPGNCPLEISVPTAGLLTILKQLDSYFLQAQVSVGSQEFSLVTFQGKRGWFPINQWQQLVDLVGANFLDDGYHDI